MTIATLARPARKPNAPMVERAVFAGTVPSIGRRLLWRWLPNTAPR
jgi:hypothetical protein